MKAILKLIVITIIFQSCQGQKDPDHPKKPDKIVVKNEVYCNYHNFKLNEVQIEEEENVTEIWSLINKSMPIERPVNTLKLNNGRFSIILYKNGDKIADYRIVYTIYDGVVLDGANGQTYKNDELERVINQYFK